MVTTVRSLGLTGVSGYEVTVECMLSGGLPAFDVVGLPDAAVKESRERGRAAVKNCGAKFPVSRITVNLAPAGQRKEGTVYDLPILLGILTAAEELKGLPEDAAFLGELSLTGALRPVTGVLPMALCAARMGIRQLFVPAQNAPEATLAQGITVYQPTKMRDGTALALVRELHPELIVVAAYGRILPEDILNTPPYGSINVHSSLLPKYRGAAPINWAILNGERETGVTIMYMARELDAGDILHVLKTDIDPQEDAQTLTARLAELGAQALSETVEQLRAGTAHRTVQDHSAYTYAPMLTKDMGVIDWTKPAGHIHNQVRGLIPWPCASTELGGATVKIFRTEVLGETGKAPGAVAAAGKAGIDVACGDGHLLRILELQPQGGRRMAAADYLRGHPLQVEA